MFFTLEKLEARTAELGARRYFGNVTVAPFTAMPGQLGSDEVYHCLPDQIQGNTYGLNDYFEGRDRYLWIEKEVTLLPEKEGCNVVGLFNFGRTGDGFNSSFESLLYVDDEPCQGVDTYHNEVLFSGLAGKKVKLTFLLWTGLEGGGKHKNFYHQCRQADIAYLHEASDGLYYYADAITRTIRLLPEESTDRILLTQALDRAFYEINWDEDAFYDTVNPALNRLQSELGKMEKHSDVTIHAIGHTHIDVAWLWRLKHTREKVQRSFSTVLHLMEHYEDYVFLQTQPQLYQYIKQDAPKLFARIKEKVNDGKWEPEGGMWLEADCNLISGESLVRQLLYGIRFMEEEFGKKCEFLWLPDVFGYSWALPQILKQCGISTFMTSKISWNQYNEIPQDLFWWRGMDGSEILTYFITTPPEGQDMTTGVTYNGLLTPYSVSGSWKKFKSKNLSRDVLLPYGYGDGGGGVTRDMLELRRKMDQIPGLPHVKTGSAGAFFKKLHESVEQTDQYVHTWNGELYLEYHRGTYTSQAYNKRTNRMLENWLFCAESLCSMAYAQGYAYPQKELHDSWETVLLHQFHDIIPGSSIHEVYEDSRVNYGKVQVTLSGVMKEMEETLTVPAADHYGIYSVCSFPGNEQIFIAEEKAGHFRQGGNTLMAQRTAGGCYVSAKVTPYQIMDIQFCPGDEEEELYQINRFDIDLKAHTLETPFYSISWTEEGWIAGLFDKEAGRQVLEPNQYGNVLEIYEDKPVNFDAWDIDIFYQEKMETVKLSGPVLVAETGALRTVLRFSYHYHESVIEQDMITYSDSKRIDFVTHVNWQESHRLLKTAFYVDIHVPKAAYDIQFGHVERPTHWNTSWDWAKFEVCAHKWADLSETGYGVSLFNDCKYGYSIKDNAMKLSLLKSAEYPDCTADMGEHDFTYSLFPHKGNCMEGTTIEEANRLNLPAIVFPHRAARAPLQLISVTSDAVMVDAVKKAEKEECLIVRLHECRGSTVSFSLKSDVPIQKMARCNLLEEDEMLYEPGENLIRLKPFEICTIKIYL